MKQQKLLYSKAKSKTAHRSFSRYIFEHSSVEYIHEMKHQKLPTKKSLRRASSIRACVVGRRSISYFTLENSSFASMHKTKYQKLPTKADGRAPVA